MATERYRRPRDYAVDIHDYGDMQRRIQLGEQLAQHLQGASENWQLVLCVGWPVPPTNPSRRLDVTGAPTLIVHATHDPSTSYKNAFGLAAQIRGSSVLTRTGDGHTSCYTSDCARTAIDQYLVHPAGAGGPGVHDLAPGWSAAQV